MLYSTYLFGGLRCDNFTHRFSHLDNGTFISASTVHSNRLSTYNIKPSCSQPFCKNSML